MNPANQPSNLSSAPFSWGDFGDWELLQADFMEHLDSEGLDNIIFSDPGMFCSKAGHFKAARGIKVFWLRHWAARWKRKSQLCQRSHVYPWASQITFLWFVSAATKSKSLFFHPQVFLRVRPPLELDFFQQYVCKDLTQKHFI